MVAKSVRTTLKPWLKLLNLMVLTGESNQKPGFLKWCLRGFRNHPQYVHVWKGNLPPELLDLAFALIISVAKTLTFRFGRSTWAGEGTYPQSRGLPSFPSKKPLSCKGSIVVGISCALCANHFFSRQCTILAWPLIIEEASGTSNMKLPGGIGDVMPTSDEEGPPD